MNEIELKNESDFKMEEKLMNLILFYAVGVTLCRLVDMDMRYIAFMDFKIYRKDLVEKLPYYCMPFIAFAWLQWKKESRAGLFFTAVMVLIEIFNHVCAVYISIHYAVPFFQPNPYMPQIRIDALISLILAVIFAILAWMIFLTSIRLYKQKKHENQTKKIRVLKTSFALLLLLFFYTSPFMGYKEFISQITISRQDYESVTVLHAGSRIQYMTGSPDGKLLAIGAVDGLSVWDADTQQCVWSDDSLRAVRRIRFSQSGKYLAAGGRGAPEGESDIAVYEVEGFRRLPEVEFIEEDLTKNKLFHDIAFRPDEKSLLLAWHKDWDWDQIPGGINGKEAINIRSQEGRMTPHGKFVEKDLIFTELSLEERGKEYSKMIKTLSEQYDLLLSGGIGFSPSASYLLYPSHYITSANKVAYNRLYLVDTRTWLEEEIMLRDEYNMLVTVGTVSNNKWYEWKFTRDEKNIYLLAQEIYIGDIGRGINTPAYLLMKIDLKTKVTQEIFKISKSVEMRNSAWLRIALSQDEGKIALLALGELLNNYSKPKGTYEVLRIVDLITKETRQTAYQHNRKDSDSRQIVWLTEEIAAVFLREKTDEFFFCKIKEEL